MFVNEKMRTHLLLFSLIGCVSLLCLSFVRCDAETENESNVTKKGKDCSSNGTIVLSEFSGSLRANLAEKHKEVLNCTWIIEVNKTNGPLFFRIDGFKLAVNDKFSIKKNETIFDKSKVLENSILFTGVTEGNVSVELILQVDSGGVNRVFDVAFTYNNTVETLLITSANRNGFFTLPIYNPDFKSGSSIIDEFKLDLQLQPPLDDDFKLVVGFEEMTIVPTVVSIEGDESKVGRYTREIPDLIAEKSVIGIKLTKFNLTETKANQMVLYYTVYNKKCTDFKEISDLKETAITTPANATQSSLDCLWILSSPNSDVNFLLDYTDVHFFNDMDFFTIRSGNRRNSSVVAVVNNQNKGHVQNSFRDTISMGKNLYITYSSPPAIIKGYSPSTISISPMKGGGYFIQPTKFNLKLDKPTEKPVIYVFKNDSKRATLESSKQSLSKGSLKLFDTDEIAGSEPFAIFTEGEAVPELIVSPSRTLRLEFYNVTVFDGSLNKTDSELNLVAALNTASFMVTSATLNCSQSSSWLIPKNPQPKANETIFSVQTPYLSLNTSDELTLTKYSNKVADIFTIKGAKDFNAQFLPDFLFFANSTYLFKYSRGKDCNPKDNSVLLQLSYNLNHLTDYETTIPLQSGGETTIEPDTYPNMYPLREQELNTFCLQQNRGCGWFVTHPNNGTVLTTVLDIDLASGDSLDLLNKKLTTNELPPDELSPKVFVKMSAQIKKSMVISEKLSGRGFKLNVTEYECGGTFEYPKDKSLKISFRNKTTCAWIVKVNDKEKGRNGNYLEFKYESKNGKLTIIDSPSLRDKERDIKINKSLVYQPASVNQTILIYEVSDATKAAELDISWKIEQCKEWCKNGFRCILDSWRCDNVSQCGDWSDEMNCNIPPNCPDAPPPKSGGVSGWVIAFVIFPLAMIVGAIVAKFGPTVIRRFRGSSYQEFRDFSEVS